MDDSLAEAAEFGKRVTNLEGRNAPPSKYVELVRAIDRSQLHRQQRVESLRYIVSKHPEAKLTRDDIPLSLPMVREALGTQWPAELAWAAEILQAVDELGTAELEKAQQTAIDFDVGTLGALTELGRIVDRLEPATISMVFRLAESPDSSVRRYVLGRLTKVGLDPDQVVATVNRRLRDPVGPIRYQAAAIRQRLMDDPVRGSMFTKKFADSASNANDL